MDFDEYSKNKKKAEVEEGSGGESGGYDTSGITMSTSDDSKVPPRLDFNDTVYRGLMTDAHYMQPQPAAQDWSLDSQKMLSAGTQMRDKLGMQIPGPESFSFAPPKAQGPGTAFLTTPQVQVVNHRALEPEPIYYEKYSSFTTPPGDSPQVLLTDISNVFAETSNVDHEPSFGKNKIKGVAYENNGRCTFKVRLYENSRVPTSILCEFQRRSGCVVSFNKFYRRTLKQIEAHVSRKAGERSGNWLTTITRVEQDANAEPSVQLDEATADNLIAMAGCDNVDVQREGAQALANVAKFPQNQEKLAEMHSQSQGSCRIVALLEKLLGSIDTELCRSGCVFLACMASQGSMQAVLIEKCLEKMIDILNAPLSFETTDSKRQVAMALSLLAHGRASDVVAHSKGHLAYDVLKKIYEEKRFTDSSLKSSVTAAFSALHNARQ